MRIHPATLAGLCGACRGTGMVPSAGVARRALCHACDGEGATA